MTEKEKYAVEWNESAQYFYDNNSYTQLTAHIKHFKRVLEIGCGTGQSTLSLLKAGHSVVAIDQNPHCIKIAKKLVSDAGFDIKESLKDLAPRTVFFLEKDITDSGFLEMICASLSIDIVVCWNIGSYWDKQKDADVIPKMLEYGLTADQIQQNMESSYAELVIWTACKIAKGMHCAVHIVDRGTHPINRFNDPYYMCLKKEFNYKRIRYANIKSTTLSSSGRLLITEGQVNKERELPIIFISILLK